ncbi:hypothetical protein [Fortiea sp. LEGE XX443]|uniref:hypothetical protein n=1 Tax=Fortiea sp. LEGE XX443 TaxID=1828611 RepID=UPI001D14C807|nr:hypothetical protein [Fortiea sp. LEGE XX443]
MNSTPVSQVRWTMADLAIFEGDRNHVLKLTTTLYSQDELTSPLLPGFSCIIGKLLYSSSQDS